MGIEQEQFKPQSSNSNNNLESSLLQNDQQSTMIESQLNNGLKSKLSLSQFQLQNKTTYNTEYKSLSIKSEIREEYDENNKYSLHTTPLIKTSKKFSICFFLMLNVAMFIYCNIAEGAVVNYSGSIMGFETKHFDLSVFTLYGSVKQMWQAKVYPLAIIILTFSGIWPYMKLGGMILCWFLSQQKMSYMARERILVILDVMGKWSLIDTYFMLMMIVAFNFVLDISIMKINVGFNITVTPEFDFYCFVMATMMSLILTHVIIHEHRKTLEIKQEEKKKKQEGQGEYELRLQRLEEKYCLGYSSGFYKWFIPILIGSGFVIMAFGYFVDVFTFTFKGLAGWAQGQNASNSYSLYDIGALLPFKTYDPYSFGIRMLQLLYFVFTFVVPFTFLSLMMVLYTCKIKLKYLKKLFVLSEILYAWASIDVLTLAMVSSLIEIRTFAQFMIGDKLNGLDNIVMVLNNLFPEVFNLGDDPVTFDMQTKLEMGAALLIASSVIFIILGTSCLRNLQKKLENKLENIGDRKMSIVSSVLEDLENKNIPSLRKLSI